MSLTLLEDIEKYADEIKRFMSGEMDAANLKARRVPRGVYEQRQDGTYMVRVRITGGVFNVQQVRELARIGGEFGNGMLHVTSRQDIQFHDVALTDTPQVMRRLLSAGLTTRGGGGNTVRNVTACPYAGICPSERFDVTSCAQAVTDYLIGLTGSYNLPRKYKIAFSGCAADCALAQTADLGFIAEMRDGQPGFRVLAGGGMGAKSRIADLLLEWTPASEILRVAETVRRLFDKLGDRENKHRARLRFVIERLGIQEFIKLYYECYRKVVADGVPECLDAVVINPKTTEQAEQPMFEHRDGLRVVRQRQPGLTTVFLHTPLGFISAADLGTLGCLAARFSSEGGLRTTLDQNLLMRGVAESDLSALATELRAHLPATIAMHPLDRFTACAGAATCRLGICLARHAAKACADAFTQKGVARATLDALTININGCPNACGRQPVATIGLFGAALRAHDRLVPAYGVTLGGRCDSSGARFGAAIGKIPAAALPEFLSELVLDFQMQRAPGELFAAYHERKGTPYFKELAEKFMTIPDPAAHPEFYRDLGMDNDFSLAGRGPGECSSGVFEVINRDIQAARAAETPFEILYAAARALLITRGVDARDPATVFTAFEKHFIDSALVDSSFRALFDRARGFLQGWQGAFDECETKIIDLRDRIELLYKALDASLQFHPPNADAVEQMPRSKSESDQRDESVVELDLRGVACPMNFVKAKLRLEMLGQGETLVILLDDGEPVRNVPASLRSEGHAVDDLVDLGNGHWRFRVRKA